ncbi:MAG: sigma 54-interacting transcriptional regulator [Myxococcota bacterium]
MTVETIAPSASADARAESARPSSHLALALVWSRDEPSRVGEIAVFAPGRSWMLGRGRGAERGAGHGAEHGKARVEFGRQRPGELRITGPLSSTRISRTQLSIVSDGTRLLVRNHGRCRLRHEGRAVMEASVVPGDLIELDRAASLLCIRREADETGAMPPRSEELVSAPVEHEFGRPDAQAIVGESPAVWHLRALLHFVALRRVHVLVHGPSGTGKELAAAAIHRLSARASRPLVSRNAATLPPGLIDAELFGNARNYPNPGMAARPGLIGEADGSTLFLDEVAELPEASQVHLLRVLDDGEYSRLGEAGSRRADLRLVAATNRPLCRLKHDLRARFVVTVEMPGLDQRREDIPLLAEHLLRGICAEDPDLAARWFDSGDPRGPARLSAELVARLVGHEYATNMRELEALLWQELIGRRDDGVETSVPAPASSPTGAPTDPADEPERSDATIPRARASELSPEEIQRSLDRHGGRQEPAWRELGLSSRYALARLVRKYGLRVRGRGR